MKMLRKIQTKAIVLGIALFLSVFSLFTGIQFSFASAETASNETETVYIDTEVKEIAFVQHPSCVYFGFRLTESDYDDFGRWEGDFGSTSTYAAYEKYVASELTYWKNFSQNNSEGVIFDQLYAYWNGSSVGPAMFVNTVAHRSTLKNVEYGFVISIPAGTTFPSATYVRGNCEGTPIMYRTTEDKAFYYDGATFTVFPYASAQYRASAVVEVESVNYTLYYEAESAEVKTLVNSTKEKLQACLTNVAVQDVMSEFYSELDKIMTIGDYEEFALKQEEAKQSLSLYFDGFSQENYEETNWNAVLKIKNEYGALLEAAKNIGEVDAIVTSVKFAAEKVLTKDEQAAFTEYQASAIDRIEKSFVESLYREEERAQGAALVQEAKAMIGKAASYDDVDGWEAEYLSRISELKTQAEWEAEEEQGKEEENVPNDSAEQEQTSVSESESKQGGCSGSVNQIGMIFGVVAMLMPMVIRNKKRTDKENEE